MRKHTVATRRMLHAKNVRLRRQPSTVTLAYIHTAHCYTCKTGSGWFFCACVFFLVVSHGFSRETVESILVRNECKSRWTILTLARISYNILIATLNEMTKPIKFWEINSIWKSKWNYEKANDVETKSEMHRKTNPRQMKSSKSIDFGFPLWFPSHQWISCSTSIKPSHVRVFSRKKK